MNHSNSAIINLSINTHFYHLPLVGNMFIDWGDGTTEDVDYLLSGKGVIHVYEETGTYTVTVKGAFMALEHHEANKVTSVTTDTEEVIDVLLVEGV